MPIRETKQPGRPDLDSNPHSKPKVDVTAMAVLGPRENRADETKLGSTSRGAKRKLRDGKKRKEDHPGPDSSRKKRRIEGGKKRSTPKEVVGQASAKKAEDSAPPTKTDGPASSAAPQDGLDGEILGMLIESMALSRASSLPVSSLCKSVMQSRPAFKAQKSDKEWTAVFLRVLEGGVVGRGSGIFGKIESSGKASHYFLEFFKQ